ncbi:MAG: hypothetical protein JSW40_06305 [Candidatus Omnitrophota bacterium]|nr:MAG: hypothetical protein JSW40_06305 [Candidatus Omnitrophota bacterium]
MKSSMPFVLILCGGKSLRLWPLSEYKSKNFLNVFGFSPLELTIRRFLKVTTKENIFLVTNQNEQRSLKRIKLIKKENILFEPESKNTAPAILFSLQCLKKRLPQKRLQKKVLIISPVDHLIKHKGKFYSVLKKAIGIAEGGSIVTLGIAPKEPSPHFGYIQTDKKIAEDVYSVKRFIEKPDAKRAARLIRGGKSFHNSGMFIASLDTLENEYRKHYFSYKRFVSEFQKKKITSLYRKLQDIPFDKAIVEKTRKLRLLKAQFFWRDFGSWHTLYEILPKDKSGNVKKGVVSITGAKNNLFYLDNPKKRMLAVGLKDIFFIDTQHFCLLSHRALLDNLKPILKIFKKIA